MKPHQSLFERGRKIVILLIAFAIFFGVAGLMFSADNSRSQIIYILCSFACILGVVITSAVLCRCPHCGKRIVNGVLVVKVCPRCKRSLTTGKKIKR